MYTRLENRVFYHKVWSNTIIMLRKVKMSQNITTN
jgi:hypothetical protein